MCLYSSLIYLACKLHIFWAILYCRVWPVWLYDIFLHDFQKKKILNIKHVFWFSLLLLPETYLRLRRIQQDIIINLFRSSCKLPVFLSEYSETLILLTDFLKVFRYQTWWKSIQWELHCSMQMDDWTDGQIWQSAWSLFAILWMCLKMTFASVWVAGDKMYKRSQWQAIY
jgi:hypothetical protein